MIRDAFNWLASKPSSQYTLGHNAFPFNRAGRLVERIVSVPPLVVGAGLMLLSIPAALAGAPVAATIFTAGALTATFGKAVGLIKGGIVHLGAKVANSLVDYVTRPREEKQPKYAPPQIRPLQ